MALNEEIMGNETGQMAKKDAPLRCEAMTPEKEPPFRCVWHVNKHPEAHLAITHDHNSKDAVLWYWFDPAKQPPAEQAPPSGDLCDEVYKWSHDGKLRCNKPKDHRGAHLCEDGKMIASWGWNG